MEELCKSKSSTTGSRKNNIWIQFLCLGCIMVAPFRFSIELNANSMTANWSLRMGLEEELMWPQEALSDPSAVEEILSIVSLSICFCQRWNTSARQCVYTEANGCYCSCLFLSPVSHLTLLFLSPVLTDGWQVVIASRLCNTRKSVQQLSSLHWSSEWAVKLG